LDHVLGGTKVDGVGMGRMLQSALDAVAAAEEVVTCHVRAHGPEGRKYKIKD